MLLGAKARFVGQIDASTEVNPARYDEMLKILESEKPDVVFTHWPIDQHRDHRTASVLVYDAWLKSKRSFDLFYFEVKTGLYQSQLFKPTHYVDITPVVERKKKACYLHSHGEQVYVKFTDLMHRFRGLESGCEFAEAFAMQPRKASATVF